MDNEAEIRKRFEEEYADWDDAKAQRDGWEDLDELIDTMVEDELNPHNVMAQPPDGSSYGGGATGDDYTLDDGPGNGYVVDAGSGPTGAFGASPAKLAVAAAALVSCVVVAIVLFGGGDDAGESLEDATRTDEDGGVATDERVDEEASADAEVRTDEVGADGSGDDDKTEPIDAEPESTNDERPPPWSERAVLAPTFLQFSGGDQVGAVPIDRGDDQIVIWWIPSGLTIDNLHLQSRTGEIVQVGEEAIGTGQVANGEVVAGEPFRTCQSGSKLVVTILEGGRIAAIGGLIETPFADVETTSAADVLADGASPGDVAFDAFPDCEPVITLAEILVTQFEF